MPMVYFVIPVVVADSEVIVDICNVVRWTHLTLQTEIAPSSLIKVDVPLNSETRRVLSKEIVADSGVAIINGDR